MRQPIKYTLIVNIDMVSQDLWRDKITMDFHKLPKVSSKVTKVSKCAESNLLSIPRHGSSEPVLGPKD